MSLVICLTLLISSAQASDWIAPALKLTGLGLPIQRQAIRDLKKIKDLPVQIRRELSGPRRFLALDVISALKLSEFVGDLKAIAPTEESGFFYLTLNSFVTPANRHEMYEFYRQGLLAKSTAPGAKVVLLDTLGRVGYDIGTAELDRLLLLETNPEVNAAAISYLRLRIVAHGKTHLIPTIGRLLNRKDLSRQRRAQAEALEAETHGT